MEGAQTHKTPMQPLVPRTRSKPMGKTLHPKDFFFMWIEKKEVNEKTKRVETTSQGKAQNTLTSTVFAS